MEQSSGYSPPTEEEEIGEPLTIAEENPWTNEVTTNHAAVMESGDSKAGRLKKAVAAAKEGFGNSIWSWGDSMVAPEVLDGMQMVKGYTHDLIVAMGDMEEVADAVRRGKDKRLVVVSLGVVLQVLAEAGYMSDGMRQWQRDLVVRVSFFFCGVSCGMVREFDDSVYYPQFMPAALVMKPTGSGKSFAGILASLCSMIRTDGSEVTLLHPRNGKAIWCVPTRTLANDISGTMGRIVSTEAFRLLAPTNIPRNIANAYVTIGSGEMAPNTKERMFCVMTYEYARTQLLNVVLRDPGDANAKRQPLLVSLRCVIVDEAHYLAADDERAIVVDNVVAASTALHVPILFLTATPTKQFIDFVSSYYPSPNMETQLATGRAFPIRHAAFTVPNEVTGNREVLVRGADVAKVVDRVDKFVGFRCLTETFFNPQAPGTRAIFFIQNIRDVQLLAAYMAGLLYAIVSGGDWQGVRNMMDVSAAAYLQVINDYEGRFLLKKVQAKQLVSAFTQGLQDVCGAGAIGAAPSFFEASRKTNFVTFLCLSNGIVPYFSGIGLDEKADARVRNMLIGTASSFRILVTTSVVLEGVNISGADNLYITPYGYQRITNTQYTQLSGRVGRQKEGYVETWVPMARGTDGVYLPVKSNDIIKKERSVDASRVVETDDVIDRILFAGTLTDYMAKVPSFARTLRKVERNTVDNNYYRGPIFPRVSSFYTPVSLPPEMFVGEATGRPAGLDDYVDYFSRFDSPRYSLFFDLYSLITFDPSSPRITLDGISFLLQLGEAEVCAVPSELLVLPTVVFIPIFTKYSYAFSPRDAHFDKLTFDWVQRLREMGFDAEKVSGSTATVRELSKVVGRVRPGAALTMNDMQNVELAVAAFAISLLLDPSVWKEVTNVRFIDALSYILTYMDTLINLVGLDSERVPVSPSTRAMLIRVWGLTRAVVSKVSNYIQAVSRRLAVVPVSKVSEDPLSAGVVVNLPDVGQVTLPISYLDYVMKAMNTDEDILEQLGRKREDALQEFVRSLPKIDSF